MISKNGNNATILKWASIKIICWEHETSENGTYLTSAKRQSRHNIDSKFIGITIVYKWFLIHLTYLKFTICWVWHLYTKHHYNQDYQSFHYPQVSSCPFVAHSSTNPIFSNHWAAIYKLICIFFRIVFEWSHPECILSAWNFLLDKMMLIFSCAVVSITFYCWVVLHVDTLCLNNHLLMESFFSSFKLLQCYEHWCMRLYVAVCFHFSWVKYLPVEWEDQMGSICLIFQEMTNAFFKMNLAFCIFHHQWMKLPVAPHPGQLVSV